MGHWSIYDMSLHQARQNSVHGHISVVSLVTTLSITVVGPFGHSSFEKKLALKASLPFQ